MKRSEVKVGEVYGVRYGAFSGYGADPVPARVVEVDCAVEWRVRGYSELKERAAGGGVRVEFVKPTRVGSRGLFLAKDTNDHAGPITETFVFHDKRPGCGGSVGKCFAGLWADLERDRKAALKAEREAARESDAEADAFAPVLAAYRKRLAAVGIKVVQYGDASGLHGDVTMSLDYAGEWNRRRVTGFAYGSVDVPKPIFDRLIEIAEKHGERLK